MAAKELTIAVLLTIVIGSNGGSYSNENHNYNSNYAPIPLFVFKPIALNFPKPPVTFDDLLRLFNRVLVVTEVWTRTTEAVNSGRAAVQAALGSHPADFHAALQALANASPEVAQQFLISGPQFYPVGDTFGSGMTSVINGLFGSIRNIVDNSEGVSDSVIIQQLTDVFDLLRYLATVLFNIMAQVRSGTEGNVKNYIARIHLTMAKMLDGMIFYMAYVTNFSLPKEKMASFLGFIYSKVMQLDVKPCSSPICSSLSSYLPAVKNRALSARSLYRP